MARERLPVPFLRQGRRLLEERVERSVAFEVVRLDVVDHRDGGLERQERLVILIRLNHEERITVKQRVASPARDSAPGEP